MTAIMILWELLCVALLYSVFCRLVHTSTSTHISVRIAIFALGSAALVGIGAPVYNWKPDVISMVITAASLLMQLVSARHWRSGVPESFQRG